MSWQGSFQQASEQKRLSANFKHAGMKLKHISLNTQKHSGENTRYNFSKHETRLVIEWPYYEISYEALKIKRKKTRNVTCLWQSDVSDAQFQANISSILDSPGLVHPETMYSSHLQAMMATQERLKLLYKTRRVHTLDLKRRRLCAVKQASRKMLRFVVSLLSCPAGSFPCCNHSCQSN